MHFTLKFTTGPGPTNGQLALILQSNTTRVNIAYHKFSIFLAREEDEHLLFSFIVAVHIGPQLDIKDRIMSTKTQFSIDSIIKRL